MTNQELWLKVFNSILFDKDYNLFSSDYNLLELAKTIADFVVKNIPKE